MATTHVLTTPVLEVMTRAPLTVARASTVGEILPLFDRYELNAFPVVDDAGKLCGIVTKLDLLRIFHPDENLAAPDPGVLASRRVADIMRPGVVSVEPQDPIVVAADLMVQTRLRSLPVVERRGGGRALVGIVSQGDLLRGLRFALGEQASDPRQTAGTAGTAAER